jgi:hypothetical protein
VLLGIPQEGPASFLAAAGEPPGLGRGQEPFPAVAAVLGRGWGRVLVCLRAQQQQQVGRGLLVWPVGRGPLLGGMGRGPGQEGRDLCSAPSRGQHSKRSVLQVCVMKAESPS